jgi:hypothetical protein
MFLRRLAACPGRAVNRPGEADFCLFHPASGEGTRDVCL